MPNLAGDTLLYTRSLTEKLKQCARANHGCYHCPVREECFELQERLSDLSSDHYLRRDEYIKLALWFYELTSLSAEMSHTAAE